MYKATDKKRITIPTFLLSGTVKNNRIFQISKKIRKEISNTKVLFFKKISPFNMFNLSLSYIKWIIIYNHSFYYLDSMSDKMK